MIIHKSLACLCLRLSRFTPWLESLIPSLAFRMWAIWFLSHRFYLSFPFKPWCLSLSLCCSVAFASSLLPNIGWECHQDVCPTEGQKKKIPLPLSSMRLACLCGHLTSPSPGTSSRELKLAHVDVKSDFMKAHDFPFQSLNRVSQSCP